MSRVIVNVATGNYVKGQARLLEQFRGEVASTWANVLPPTRCPEHSERPYAFKAYALKYAAHTWDTLLWCDACIVPGPRPLSDLWEKIEQDGVWLARNGWSNYEWTADSAYPDLFDWALKIPGTHDPDGLVSLDDARPLNKRIPHVVATAFGISLKHHKGRAFLDEYFRLASETKAFCGPWINCKHPESVCSTGGRCAPCGPPDVRGHRHDQTAASVIAWRLGVELTDPPDFFAYRGGETEKTCLVADGSY